jgi:hypothetical protein
MPWLKSSAPLSGDFGPAEPPRPGATHSLMMLASQGARRLALAQERADRLSREGQPAMAEEAYAQLRIMREAQQIRMRLLSPAQREIVEAEVRRWHGATAPAGRR